ncbi:MAG TPA: glycoside hydrolase domain-containing protein [Candidatus Binatia bacterium]|nr:glycoside hydrolase domain-containing protein [Candidatus Binatia bacterium]
MPRSRRCLRILAAVAVAAAATVVTAHVAALPAAAQSGAATLWGIDACDTAQDVVPGTVASLGQPEFIARYLSPNAPCSPYPALTSAEVSYAEAQGLGLMLIFDPGRFGSSNPGGAAEAQQAIQAALALGAPAGTAIYRDVEHSDPITAAYIQSWYQTFAASGSGFVPGFYENSFGGPFACASNPDGSTNSQPCSNGPGGYCQAEASMPALATGVVLWDSEPETEYGNPNYVPSPANALPWNPYPLPCANTTVAWQYLESGGMSGSYPSLDVDVDEFLSSASSLLWDASTYTPLTPFRVCDTREGAGTPCSGATADNPVGQGSALNVQVAGITDPESGESVPAGARALVLNVTAIGATTYTYLTVYPTGASPPNASNLNLSPGATQANLVVVPPGSGGDISVFNDQGQVNVAIDVEGYFAAPTTAGAGIVGLFHPIPPLRICDSRPFTATACSGTPLGAGQWTKVTVSGCPPGNPACSPSVPADGTAAAIALNLTAVSGTSFTFLSATPPNATDSCPTGPPAFSNLNVNGGTNQPNRVIVPLGPQQDVCLYNSLGTINFILDLNGWFGNGSESARGTYYHPLAPVRLCDTRSKTGTECSGDRLHPQQTLSFSVAGDDGVAAAAPNSSTPMALVANVTAVNGTANTYLTAYPAGSGSPPNASDLNATPHQTIPNLVIVQLGGSGSAGGDAALYNASGTIDAVVDVEGWFE